jgi:DivIVA domain-containing protein
MNGDDIRGHTFRIGLKGYKTTAVDDFLAGLADAVDGGGLDAEHRTLIRTVEFPLTLKGYNVDEVDLFLDDLAMGHSPSAPRDPESPKERRRRVRDEAQTKWREFESLPGLHLHWATRSTLRGAYELRDRNGRARLVTKHFPFPLSEPRYVRIGTRTYRVHRTNWNSPVWEVLDPVTGRCMLRRSGSNRDKSARVRIEMPPDILALRVDNGGNSQRSVMYAMDIQGTPVLQYRRTGSGTLNHVEVVLDPSRQFSDRIGLLIALTSSQLRKFFLSSGGGGG